MIKKIEELEAKGFRVCIYPQKWNNEWLWTGGVYIGDNTRAIWVNMDNGLPNAGYKTYKDAFDAVVNYCENPPKKHGKESKV